jgi:hypothetical protein
MLLVGEFGHIRANLRDHGLGKRNTDPVHSYQIYTTDALQVSARLPVLGRILAVRASLGRGEKGFGTV